MRGHLGIYSCQSCTCLLWLFRRSPAHSKVFGRILLYGNESRDNKLDWYELSGIIGIWAARVRREICISRVFIGCRSTRSKDISRLVKDARAMDCSGFSSIGLCIVWGSKVGRLKDTNFMSYAPIQGSLIHCGIVEPVLRNKPPNST